jgi:hypothetical protein
VLLYDNKLPATPGFAIVSRFRRSSQSDFNFDHLLMDSHYRRLALSQTTLVLYAEKDPQA